MAGLGNNLYPPIFKKAYMPAFKASDQDGCKIYFSLSVYNSISDINQNLVQISVQNQNTNYSALDLGIYPAGVKIAPLNIQLGRTSQDRYFVTISNEDLAKDPVTNEGFVPGNIYKVQIRFTGKAVSNVDNSKKITEAWLNTNIQNFSEWSQVVLIKPISEPVLLLNNFSTQFDEESFTLQDIYVSGRLNIPVENNEYLKKYRIRIYDGSDTLKEDSGEIYTNSYNHNNGINYKIKYNLEDDQDYVLKVFYQTNNLYEKEEEFPFQLKLVQYAVLDPTITLTAEGDNKGGRVKIKVNSARAIDQLSTNFVLRRSSSKQNFEYWEDIYTFLAEFGQILDLTWFDNTVQSGVWYKYSIQQRNEQGFRSNFLQTNSPVMVVFEDIFLIDNKQKLTVRFDPQVNNYSHVVSETLTQTIGSKYPFIRRNGNVDYRTFSLNGTITAFMDVRENGMKASRQDLYKNSLNDYKKYYEDNRIDNFNDSVYERDFRQKVIEFLYRNTVKLYKSTTQGNILVKLMNISFTPNNTLSRHIYSFTCTVQEVDEFSLQNCDKYGIQSMGGYIAQKNSFKHVHGQIIIPNPKRYLSNRERFNNEVSKDNEQFYQNRNVYGEGTELQIGGKQTQVIQDYIAPKYKYLESELRDIEINSLTYLKIEFTSPPYLIVQNGNDFLQKLETNSTSNSENYFLGHVIYVNNQPIIVGPQGIYELDDSNGFSVTSLRFLSPNETVYISYELDIISKEKTQNIPKMYGNFKRIGQFFGYFNSSESIYKKIYNRYYQKYQTGGGQKTATDGNNQENTQIKSTVYFQSLQSVMGLRIQAKPGTMILVREIQDNSLNNSQYETFIMNDSGLLEFYNEDSTNPTNIIGAYIVGPQLQEVDEIQNGVVEDDEYVLVQTEYEDFNEIENPQKNHVYKITNTSALTVLKSRIHSTKETYMNEWDVKESLQGHVMDFQTLLLNNEFAKTQYCIFYNGGWFLFNTDERVVLGYPNEAIIDYYCQILRQEY